MKRMTSVLAAALLLFSALPAMAADAPSELDASTDFAEYTIIEGDEVYRQDFEGEVEEEFLIDNRYQVRRDSTGSNALYIDGTSANIATGLFGPEISNCMIEMDIMQAGCNGGTNASFCVGVRSQSNSAGYRLFYSDINRFDSATRTLAGTENLRDRVGIARSTGSHNMGTWNYAGISDSLGILDTDSRAFSSYIHFQMTVTDLFLKIALYNSGGVLIDEYTLATSEADLITGTDVYNEMIKSGRFLIGTHSTQLFVDNISIKEIGIAKTAKLSVSQPVMLTGGEYEIAVLSELDSPIPSDMFKWDYDKEALQIENGKITAKKAGTYTVTAYYSDALSASLELTVADVYPFTDFEIELDKQSVFCTGQVSVQIKGSIDNQEYTTNQDLMISTDAGTVAGNTVIAAVPGQHTVSVQYNGLTKETALYVSNLTDGRIALGKSSGTVSEPVDFAVYVTENGTERKLSEQEFLLSPDDGFSIANGKLTGILTGEKLISLTVDSVLLTTPFTVTQITEGLIFKEDFEDEQMSEFFKVDSAYLTKDGDNTVMQLSDQFSQHFGDASWRNYTISGRVKILQKNMEPRRYNTSFGIYIRQSVPAENMTGGHKGIPAVFSMEESGNYLRVGTQAGPKTDFTLGQWYDFSIEAHENQFNFSFGNQKMSYSVTESSRGGFDLAAENCIVYVDDIAVSRQSEKLQNFSPERLELTIPEYTLDLYDHRHTYAMTAVKATDANGQFEYVSIEPEMQWQVASGNLSVSDTKMVRWTDEAADGDVGVLIGEYNGLRCELVLHAVKQYEDKLDYVKETFPTRRMDFMYKLRHSGEVGCVLDNSQLYYLSYMTGILFMHPTRKNYDREIEWLMELAAYETATKGVAVGGGDFVLNVMLILKYELQGVLNCSDETWAKLDQFLIEEKYIVPSQGVSENHRIIYFTDALLACELYPDAIMYNGKTGTEMKAEYTQYYLDWINQRYKYGMLEYDSTYLGIDFIALETYIQYAKDEKLKQIAVDFLDYLYADMIQDTVEDRLAGAHGRTYFNTDTLAKFYVIPVKFSLENEKWSESVGTYGVQPAIFAHSTHLPDDIVLNIALDEEGFVNQERRIVYHLPDDPKVTESLKKYTYRTPDYTMGCIASYQNPFNSTLTLSGDKYYKETGTYADPTWIAGGHQGIPMTVMYAGNDKRFILYGHPGPAGYSDVSGKHSYYSGFYNYPAFDFLQHENTMIGMYYIDNPDEAQYTHWYIPKKQFELVEEINGWVFIKQDDIFTAIKPMKDGQITNTAAYRWGDDYEFTVSKIQLNESEILIESKYCAFVMQVVSESEFGGSYEEFKEKMQALPIQYSLENNGTLSFTTLNGDILEASYKSEHKINGETINYDAYKLQDSKFIQADWGEGIITLQYEDDVKIITPPGSVMDKTSIKNLSDSIKAIPSTIKTSGLYSAKQMLDSINLKKQVEQIMSCSDEYLESVLFEQLIQAIEDALPYIKKYNLSAQDIQPVIDALEPYGRLAFEGEYVKRLTGILSDQAYEIGKE